MAQMTVAAAAEVWGVDAAAGWEGRRPLPARRILKQERRRRTEKLMARALWRHGTLASPTAGGNPETPVMMRSTRLATIRSADCQQVP